MAMSMESPVLTILLLQLLLMLVQVQSSCLEQNYLTYVRDSSGKTMGQIRIPSPPKNIPLHLKVGLSVAAALSGDYVGRIKLAQSEEDSSRVIQQGGPLYYYVHFPPTQSTPVVTEISFNDNLYCTGPPVTGNLIVTSITLEHTLFPSQVSLVSPNSGSSVQPTQGTVTRPYSSPSVRNKTSYYAVPVPITTTTTTTTTTTNRPSYHTVPVPQPNQQNQQSSSSVSKKNTINTNGLSYQAEPVPQPNRQNQQSNPSVSREQTTTEGLSEGILNNVFLNHQFSNHNNDCGRPSHANHSHVNQLISGGEHTSPGQWPWLVALFVVKLDFDFQCAGSILTNKHILTAAHCCKLDPRINVDIPANVMYVSLGRFRLRDWWEEGSVNREVESYTLHPDYEHRGNGDSDIAILTLRRPVEFTPRIKPVCLWPAEDNLQNVINKTGHVVGWGRDEFGTIPQEPRMAKLPIVSQLICLWNGFRSFISNRTFCAGRRDGTGPCNGDSGSGLVLYDQNADRYYLRGIVSRSLFDREMACDLKQFVVFADVAKFADWIKQNIVT